MLLGDFILVFSILVWMAVAVGPWWVAVVIFVVANLLNYLVTKSVNQRIEKAKKDQMDRMIKFINSYKEEFPEE